MAGFAGAGLVAACWIPRTPADAGSPGSGITVRSGTSPITDELFWAEIVNIGLNRLGFQTAPLVQLSYPLLITAVANGDVDLTPVFVEPNFDSMFENAGGENRLRKVGDLWQGVNGYQIDKRTADRHRITNLQQLRDPTLAALFDADGDGKADLVGCDPGWSCEPVIDHQIDAYGLRDTVSVKKGNYAALIADVLARNREGKPVLFYTWSPYWLGQVLKTGRDVVWLEVPFTSYPANMGGITAKETSVDGKNLGLAQGRCRAVGNRAFLDKNPAITRFLAQVKIPSGDLLLESFRIKQGEDKPEDVRKRAEEWVAGNRDVFQGWLAQAGIADGRGTAVRGPAARPRQALQGVLDPFRTHTIHLDAAVSAAMDSAARNFRPLFQAVRSPVAWVLREVRGLLLAAPPLALLLLIGLVAWRTAGVGAGLYSLLALTLIGFLGLWEPAMISCAIVVTSVVFSIAAGIPLGVVCARSNRFERIMKPLLDAMQTLPTLVYLVPVVMLFGTGEVPGVIATVIYALPPLIRFTNLGIRQVSGEVVEAARAFGSTPAQVLWEVQIPLALPTIMAGVNQSVLFALGMTVIASMIAVPGLGLTILEGVGRLDVGTAAVGGLAIVLLAILLDRITQGIARVAREKEFGD